MKKENQADLSDPDALLDTLWQLRQEIAAEGQEIFAHWKDQIQRRPFLLSGINLANYLAFRRRDLRLLQTALMPLGLSSLGRSEARVMPNLDAVITSLAAVCGRSAAFPPHPRLRTFFRGDRLLEHNTDVLLGVAPPCRHVRIMVTLPTEAAIDPSFVRDLLRRGTQCIRINCAHDTPEVWEAMIAHLRSAESELGQNCKVLMDLAGPKARTGPVITPNDKARLVPGNTFLLTRGMPFPESSDEFQAACTLPALLDQLRIGAEVCMDDGRLRARVMHICSTGLMLQVTHTRPKGEKLRPDKSLNFPGTVLDLEPLTDKDRRDLLFVARHADIIGYSYVQEAGDILRLQQELAQIPGRRAHPPALLAKIETPRAVRNLPELIAQGAGKNPMGVMIARGDLAIEVGYERLAEIQEEILWICEAAHVPVVWATQVLEGFVKTGMPSRAEITDAAMSERAECVMLNKGPYVAEAVTVLDDVLTRMEAHQEKKTSRLRALHSW